MEYSYNGLDFTQPHRWVDGMAGSSSLPVLSSPDSRGWGGEKMVGSIIVDPIQVATVAAGSLSQVIEQWIN